MEAVVTPSIFAPIVTKSAYELERGKPIPSIKHAMIQTNLIIALS